MAAVTCVVSLFCLVRPSRCWQRWSFSSFTDDEWRKLWTLGDGPGERRGHSLVTFNKSKVVLFGGRGNDAHRRQVPKRFDVEEDGGVLRFSPHDVPLSSDFAADSVKCRPIETCVPLTSASSGNEEVCSLSWEHLLQHGPSPTERTEIEKTCGFVPVGTYYNDVWVYDTDCSRYADHACVDNGWRILHPGLTFGGCNNEQGEHVCETPSERYGHGAAMLNASTMAVYGGYSHECEDFCDDLWLFDLRSSRWTKVEGTPNPGNRHDFSMVSDANAENAAIYLFGGHRLWHGFGDDNSAKNRWKSTKLLPQGGYLNDLWVYRNDKGNDGEKEWVKVEGKMTCVDDPGLTWESRNDKRCDLHWPSARSGHTAVYDEKRGGIWLHGGFSTYYPYPTNKDPGSGLGVRTKERQHNTLTPAYKFYLDDLWFYHISSGFWEKKIAFGRKPQPRTNHILALSGNLLLLHGGFGDNFHFEDTWHYSIVENRWIEKTDFVHASYPETCTDDLITIQQDTSCIELGFPSDLKRSNESTLALKYQEILPFNEQMGFTPDPEFPLYFGIVDSASELVKELRQKYLEREVYNEKGERIWLESTVADGTPIAPNAATAPRQYARQKRIKYNETTELEVWEWCVSVSGEPTRDRTDSEKLARSNTSVLIPQPRRQSPGWDGCAAIKWKHPTARADHASVYVEKFDMLVMYGGIGYGPGNGPYAASPTVLGDLWVLNMHNCAHNCSGNGVCTDSFCECDPGYFGVDCSNVTCPGSVCHYDANRNQHCTHCCYDDVDGRKAPCQLTNDELMIFSGRSEGICDGFGTCQCAPPYIGEDCSILDCPYNCSFNGYCIVEFPQSRCMCKDGYTGEFCQHLECLNNCSYPNGICNQETGSCSCRTLYSPYNISQPWGEFQGQDCSFLPVPSTALAPGLSWLVWLLLFGLQSRFS